MRKGLHILNGFRKRWLAWLVLESLALAWMLMALVGTIAYYIQSDMKEWLPALVFVLAAILWFYYRKGHQVSLLRVMNYLDLHDAQLENSSTLILKTTALNLLEDLQLEKLDSLLKEQEGKWRVPVSKARLTVFVVMGILLLLLAYYLSPSKVPAQPMILNAIVSDSTHLSEKPKAIHIQEVKIIVKAPAYTKVPSQTLPLGALEIWENSSVQWQISLSEPAESLMLIFQTKDSIKLSETGAKYIFSQSIIQSTFYQIMLTKGDQVWLSDFYRIHVQEDTPPQIELKGLDERTEYTLSEQSLVPFRCVIQDDFGIQDAYMVATVTKGEGESVKFREERLYFENSFPGQKEMSLGYCIDFNALKMEAGDELYFYIVAVDNRQPKANITRSDMYFLSLKDSSKVATYVEGGLAVDLMPEYFRSQRQIIIDTEQLLADKKDLDVKTYQIRSNALAADQKILRLRYGQFLGEEFESGIGPNALENLKAYYLSQNESEKAQPDTEVKKKVSKMFGLQLSEGHYVGDGHNHDDEALKEYDKVGNGHNPEMSGQQDALQLLQPYIHAHDESEEATFFDSALKAKLKAALTEMWEAELRLRLYQPKDALPFEYKALEMIKEIQQQSRIYVERVGFEAPPLKEEKRLTGKWQDIENQKINTSLEPEQPWLPIQKAIVWTNEQLQDVDQPMENGEILRQASLLVSKLAIEQPGKDYLKTLQLIKQLENQDIDRQEKLAVLILLRQQLNQILGNPMARPNLQSQLLLELRQEYLKTIQRP